jgi:hypothetical protein
MDVTDFRDIYAAHAAWSRKTFGEDHERGPVGPLKHLIKEAEEAMENPSDPHEFADCMFLTMDAARRAGHDVNALLLAMVEKLEILNARTYRKVEDGQPSFHVKEPKP